MGNTASAPNSSTQETNILSLSAQIDEIAMNYMLTQNTIDLIRLTDKEYYDNLIILTGNIFEKRLNNLELGYLKNRIVGNKIGNKIDDILPTSNKLKEKIITDISKFYIKIIMVYSAIASTIDPQYSYEDTNGQNKSFYLKDFDEYKNIPKNVSPKLVQLTNPMSLCRKRLSILKNRYDDTTNSDTVILNPGEKLCAIDSTVKLTDEIGIKELDLLYYDIFDYKTRTWNKKSNKMKQKYNKDLTLFYQIFTGKKVKPSTIQSFQDIELLDFKTLDNCSTDKFQSDIVIAKENKLIKQYKEKIDLIQSSTEKYKNNLFSILKELFVIKMIDNKETYTINPDLTLDKITLLEEQTRDIILNLYISCEKYFIQALIIFENIYESNEYTINQYKKENLMNIKHDNGYNSTFDTLSVTPNTITPPFTLQTPNVPSIDVSLNPTLNIISPIPNPETVTTPNVTTPNLNPETVTPPSNVTASNVTTPIPNPETVTPVTPVTNVTATNVTTPIPNPETVTPVTPVTNVTATNVTTPIPNPEPVTPVTPVTNVTATNVTTPIPNPEPVTPVTPVTNVTASNVTTPIPNPETVTPLTPVTAPNVTTPIPNPEPVTPVTPVTNVTATNVTTPIPNPEPVTPITNVTASNVTPIPNPEKITPATPITTSSIPNTITPTNKIKL